MLMQSLDGNTDSHIGSRLGPEEYLIAAARQWFCSNELLGKVSRREREERFRLRGGVRGPCAYHSP